MKVKIDSQTALPGAFKDLANLTGYAVVNLNDINYDDFNSQVNILFKAKSITGYKKRFTGGEDIPLYSENWNNYLLQIYDVKEFNQKICDDELTEFSVLFGVKIQDREVYLCSVEECSGTTLVEISIIVNSYKIQLLQCN
jgi:hypothetical protein